MPQTATERKEDLAFLRANGYSIEMIESQGERATWYRPDGLAIRGLPCDPYHRQKYRLRGWTLRPPELIQLAPTPVAQVVPDPVVQLASEEVPVAPTGVELASEEVPVSVWDMVRLALADGPLGMDALAERTGAKRPTLASVLSKRKKLQDVEHRPDDTWALLAKEG